MKITVTPWDGSLDGGPESPVKKMEACLQSMIDQRAMPNRMRVSPGIVRSMKAQGIADPLAFILQKFKPMGVTEVVLDECIPIGGDA